MKVGKLGEEVSEKIKCAVRAKLTELGIHIDNELPDYVMVLVANKKSQKQMDEDLTLFLGDSTTTFTTWLYDVLKKLEQVTISSKGMKRKIEEKKVKHKKTSESTNLCNKKVKVKNENPSLNCTDSEEMLDSLTDEGKRTEKSEEQLQPTLNKFTDEDVNEEEEVRMIIGEDEDAIQLHDNNDEGSIPDRPGSSLAANQMPADTVNLIESVIKEDHVIDTKEDIKPRERIKIIWDNNNTQSKQTIATVNKDLEKNKASIKEKDWESDRKGYSDEHSRKSNERDNQLSSSVKSHNEIKSNMRETSDYLSSKIIDARDIIKKKSSSSSKLNKSEARQDKHRRSKRSRDKSSKENRSRCLSAVSKPVKREPEKPAIPSLVTVTPRPVIPPGMQPSCTLFLKAVAVAEKSIASTKAVQKKVPNKKGYKDAKSDAYKRPQRENISITLLNDRIVSSDVDESSCPMPNIERYDELTNPEMSEPPASQILETVANEREPSPLRNNSRLTGVPLQPEFPSAGSEPMFIITLDSTASETEMEGDIDMSHQVDDDTYENGNKDYVEEALSVVRQPFDKSRLGPRLGPPVTDDDLGISRIEASQESDLEQSETSESWKLQTRCKYWPCCDAGNACPYFHPTTLCKLFPACHFGDKCLYIHPACKFADKCMRTKCPFAHTSSTPVVGTFKAPLKLSSSNGQICMYYPNCKKPFCPYLHVKMPCKFGRLCTKPNCEFEHPKNPYKWVAQQ